VVALFGKILASLITTRYSYQNWQRRQQALLGDRERMKGFHRAMQFPDSCHDMSIHVIAAAQIC
jgi:hypothetical protein